MTKELQIAFDHVKQFHPTLSIVVFGLDGRWQYMDEDFGRFKFDERIDVGILEAAGDSVENNETLPYVYQAPLED